MAKPPSPVSSRMHFSQTSFLSGHEAFSSLVDVASKQPFLPVPTLKDDKRPNIPMISIDQPGPINEDMRYQMAREQMALQTAMQRHHIQQVLVFIILVKSKNILKFYLFFDILAYSNATTKSTTTTPSTTKNTASK